MRPSRRLVALAGCALVLAVPFLTALTAVAAPATAAAARGIGLRLLDAPVSAGADPRARVYIVDHLAPGTVIHRRVEVSNTTPATAQVALYAAAASIAKGGFLGAAGHTPNAVSSWTSVQPSAVALPAGGRVTATVTIKVPRDAAPGEEYGVVWAEARSAPRTTGGVIQVSRVGIRLYLSIGPGGAPAANFTIDTLTAKRSPDGRPTVLAKVHNDGGRALDMSGTLRLTAGPGGLSAGPFPAQLGVTLAIDDTEPVSIALDKQLPAGPWEARITLKSGLLERSAQATVTFPKAGTAPAVTTSSRRPGWLYPVIVGAVVLLLLGVGTGVLGRRRRRGGGTRSGPDHPRRSLVTAAKAGKPRR